jgi:2-methylcitrate dehydratase PrpD
MPAETQAIAEYVARARLADLPQAVRHEGVRAFLNWLGCTLGGCRHEIVETVDRTLGEFSGPAVSIVVGRSRRYDMFLASCLNCISSSVYTFDDTHAEAIVHPTGPVASAVFALAERHASSGADVLLALCLGVEIECRLSKAISVPPARGSIAWSQTGICGGVGAAVAAGKLLGLSADQIGNAIGIAASQAAGFRAMHATMNLHLMHGRTASSGLRAALLAKNGLTSSPTAIEGHFGFAEMFSETPNLAALTGGLGEIFELLANTYKPYPCGIVINPVIDACLDLCQQLDGEFDPIANIRIEVCRAALDLCYRRKPLRPLDAQVSLSHWAAVALARGRVSIDGYDAATLSDPDVHALQDRMEAVLNEGLQIDQTIVAITLKDGRVLKERVEHCVGSQARPMTDQQLEQKYRSQALTVMPAGRVEKLGTLCWQLAELSSVEEIVRTLS